MRDWLSKDNAFSLNGKRVYVAGHRGMVGSALQRRLAQEQCEVLTNELDLREQSLMREWMAEQKPDVVIIAAAHVGGIGANASAPAEFLYNNLMIEANIIHAAHEVGVSKLLFLGSSCIYPKNAEIPIKPKALLSGALEPTNEAYALAKIAGVKLCAGYREQYGCDFISAMPCNLYGVGDRYDLARSHVIPALMMKAHAAKSELIIWGSGKPLREFLYVDDLADACVFMLERYSGLAPVNVGSGVEGEVSIADLARAICGVVGFDGALKFDASKPDGVARKVMDSSAIYDAGWSPSVDLQAGLRLAYDDYLGRFRDAA